MKECSIILREIKTDDTFWMDLSWGSPAARGSGYLHVLPIDQEEIKTSLFNGDNRIAMDPSDLEVIGIKGIQDTRLFACRNCSTRFILSHYSVIKQGISCPVCGTKQTIRMPGE